MYSLLVNLIVLVQKQLDTAKGLRIQDRSELNDRVIHDIHNHGLQLITGLQFITLHVGIDPAPLDNQETWHWHQSKT
jgi:hypothetical protein